MRRAFAFLLMVLSALASAQTFNLREQFVPTTTPEGPWRYGYAGSPTSNFKLFTQLGLLDGILTLSALSGQNVWQNTTSGVKRSIPVGAVSVSPGLLGQPGIVRFRSPRSGWARLTGFFGAGELSLQRRKTIRINGVPIFQQRNSTTTSYDEVVYLQSGDHVDYMVDEQSSASGSTQVESEVEYLAPESLEFQESFLFGGESTSGVVTLNFAAPEGGIDVELINPKPEVVSMPTSVHVPAGSTTALFNVTAEPVETDQQVQVTSRYNGNPTKAKIKVRAPRLASMTAEKKFLVGTASTTVTVFLNSPTKNGMTVSLSSSSTALNTPTSVFVPAGASQVSFTVSGNNPPAQEEVILTATLKSMFAKLKFVVKPG